MRSQSEPEIRWLERAVFETNPALDRRRLRRMLATPGVARSGRSRLAAPSRRNRAQGSSLRALADLLARLRRPATVPAALRAKYDDSLNRSLARLVLDDVLRIHTRGGVVTGAGAYSRIFRVARNGAATAESAATQLSRQVLENAARLSLDDVYELAVELYLGHRRPVTPAWRRRFSSPAATLEQLTADAGSVVRRVLERRWKLLPPPRGTDDWLAFSTRTPSLPLGSSGVTFKLYLSPAIHAVKDTFRRALPVFATIGVEHFKIGSGAHALCRPDKFVAYFRSRETLDEAIDALRQEFGGVDVHGVPFCASADDAGLLWWGIDFHDGVGAPTGKDRNSWRMWLCQRLARYLVLARRETALPIPAWKYALDRLTLDGIDATTFAPTPDFIRDAALQPDREPP
jgi:hypothetical protein